MTQLILIKIWANAEMDAANVEAVGVEVSAVGLISIEVFTFQ